ncbi:hypothetical protein FRC02_011504 [Tulasnella sp. 418]|nr:hypothetical protein FRC02_011504 [Tulasnella sp. 418]
MILSAFKKTGVRPFNPNAISPSQIAPSQSHSTETSSPLPLPVATQSVMDALRLAILLCSQSVTPQSDPGSDSSDPSINQLTSPNLSVTPDCMASHAILQELKGTSAASLISDNLDDYNSTTPIPELTTSPLKKSMPKPTFSLNSGLNNTEIDSLSSENQSVQAQIQELRTQIEMLEEKALRYEAQLFLQDLYCWKAQMKLYKKEKRAKTARELLSNAGKHEMTAEEWIQAIEDEVSKKDRLAALKAAKNRWKGTEKKEREDQYKKEVVAWKIVYEECRVQRKKPPLKPKAPKAAPLLEIFAELSKSKGKRVEVEEEVKTDVEEAEEE